MTGPIGTRVFSVLQERGGRRVEPPKWEWMDTIFGWIVGAVSTVAAMLGWFNPKITRLDQEFDQKIADVHERVTPLAEEVAALSAHHENDRELLRSMNAKLDGIEKYLRNDRNGRTP